MREHTSRIIIKSSHSRNEREQPTITIETQNEDIHHISYKLRLRMVSDVIRIKPESMHQSENSEHPKQFVNQHWINKTTQTQIVRCATWNWYPATNKNGPPHAILLIMFTMIWQWRQRQPPLIFESSEWGHDNLNEKSLLLSEVFLQLPECGGQKHVTKQWHASRYLQREEPLSAITKDLPLNLSGWCCDNLWNMPSESPPMLALTSSISQDARGAPTWISVRESFKLSLKNLNYKNQLWLDSLEWTDVLRKLSRRRFHVPWYSWVFMGGFFKPLQTYVCGKLKHVQLHNLLTVSQFRKPSTYI